MSTPAEGGHGPEKRVTSSPPPGRRSPSMGLEQAGWVILRQGAVRDPQPAPAILAGGHSGSEAASAGCQCKSGQEAPGPELSNHSAGERNSAGLGRGTPDDSPRKL